MTRNISFSLTTQQFLNGSKDVTRRDGWEFLKPGDVLGAIEKSQGIKKGEKVKRLGMIRVVNVWRERLDKILDDRIYGLREVTREGFPHWTPEQFVIFFQKTHRNITSRSEVTRIEFERLKEQKP